MTGRSNSAMANSELDKEIAMLTQQRSTMLRRKPPKLNHAQAPFFGSMMGNGSKLIGDLACIKPGEKPPPRSMPEWGWMNDLSCPTPLPKLHAPPNLFHKYSEDRLPTERNQWSIAQRSMTHPLKTIMLDDSVRNLPRHATRSQLLHDRKRTNIPHMSFDVDMDGVVSPLDMKYSKAFDLDGDGILNKDERAHLRAQMSKDLFEDRKVVSNLAQKPITDADIQQKTDLLCASVNFTDDFNRLYQSKCRSRIAGSTGGIQAIQHHFRADENRAYGLGSDHNVTSVKTHNHGFPDPATGERARCISRSQLLEQRRRDFRDTAKLAAFKDDGKSKLFKRKADNSIQPTPV